MGVIELRRLGDTADQLADGVSDINTISNTLGPRYNTLLNKARALTGDDGLLLAELTDAQINNGLLEGRGNAEDIAEAKATIIAWETITISVRSVIDTLPQVND